jgi:hypothetical protein
MKLGAKNTPKIKDKQRENIIFEGVILSRTFLQKKMQLF